TFFSLFQDEQLTFLCILFALIVIGNFLVIMAIALSPNRRSRMNIFMMNLAIADLSAGLVNVLTDIIWKSTIDWHAGNVGCKTIRYAQGVVTYAATYALVALSLDRLHAIARPLGFTGSSFRFRLLVGLAWLCALLFSIPMLIINETRIIHGRNQCWIEFPAPWIWKLYITIIAVILFFIPAIIIAVCYIIIVCIIWSKSPALSIGDVPSTGKRYIKNGGHIYVAANNKHFRDSATSGRGLIPKAKMKTIKMTLVIVLVFVICWSPYFVFDLLDVYGFLVQTQETVALSTFIQSLAPLNSAANPIIYASFNTKMCVNLFRRRKGRQHNSPTFSTSYVPPSQRITRTTHDI
ncbi:cardioacceleratory peptide receptor-like, partial [Littorina saxatilis]|uniref:cardioacceleratory peptide receptor-like n=1 Tax=Littorina saxatilis TaxID=31220 RepID=UPI0038B4B167